MRSGLLLPLLVCSCLYTSAQTNRLEPTGNVGIGTTTPNFQLHLNSTAAGTASTTHIFKMFDAGGLARIYMHGTGSQTWQLNSGGGESGSVSVNTPGGYPGFIIYTGAEGTPANRFDIANKATYFSMGYLAKPEVLNLHSGGNVGIGTTSPSTKLDIFESGVNVPTVRLRDGDITIPSYSASGFAVAPTNNTTGQVSLFGSAMGGISLVGFSNNTDSRSVAVVGFSGKTAVDMPVVNFIARKHNGTTAHTTLTGDEPAFDFANNVNSLIRVLADGRVGIGTTAPGSLLHINAATADAPIITLSGADIGHPFTTISPTNVGAKVYALASGGLIQQGFTENDNSAVRIQGHVGATTTTKAAILLEAFKSSGAGRIPLTGTEPALLAGTGDLNATPALASLAVLANGNVGIGTITPQARLAVNGEIHSKKVKVLATGWPDYVFRKDYELPSLSTVENYIKTNGHLPGVPSAAQVEKNGVDLGDNQAILLKKIEELTLYIIALKKSNDQLQQRMSEMEKTEKNNRAEKPAVPSGAKRTVTR